MGNRVYLYCTSLAEMPAQEQQEAFRAGTGTEYEAHGFMPLFWLLLFDSSDVKVMSADRGGFEGDERPFAYLHTQRTLAISRLNLLLPLVLSAGGQDKEGLLTEWISRLDAEPYPYILVNTEELDWMGKEGALEKELLKALQHVKQIRDRGAFQLSNAMKQLCGLEDCELDECKPSWLLGNANDETQWPQSPNSEPAKPDTEQPSSAKWWKLW